MEIRAPDESDRESILGLMRVSFNASSAYVRLLGPQMRLDRFLCAYKGGSLAATAIAYDQTQWLGGNPLPAAGIGAVAAVPEAREEGIASALLRELLRRCRERGAVVSSLFPSRPSVYRRLGYEYGGILTQYRIPISDLPPGRAEGVSEMTPEDLEGIQACYRAFAARNNGLVDSADEDWWRVRVIRLWNPEVNGRAVVVRPGSDVEAYATFQLESPPGMVGFRISCAHLVGTTARGRKALLAYLRSFRGVGQELCWYGPPHEPLSHVAEGIGDTIQPVRTARFMTRVLDVAGALRARGYPPVEGSVRIAVTDDLFAENQGSFRIDASGGRVRVERTKPGEGIAVSIGALSAMLTGYASPWDLAGAGLMEATERDTAVLASLFAGPTPWMTDFF